MSVDAGLKHLKVISRGEDGGREWVPVSGGHRDKRVMIVSIKKSKGKFELDWFRSFFRLIIYYVLMCYCSCRHSISLTGDQIQFQTEKIALWIISPRKLLQRQCFPSYSESNMAYEEELIIFTAHSILISKLPN